MVAAAEVVAAAVGEMERVIMDVSGLRMVPSLIPKLLTALELIQLHMLTADCDHVSDSRLSRRCF